MLILSRKENESLTIKLPDGQIITICLLAYKGEITKIGVEAPKDVLILRSELIKQRTNC